MTSEPVGRSTYRDRAPAPRSGRENTSGDSGQLSAGFSVAEDWDFLIKKAANVHGGEACWYSQLSALLYPVK